MTDPDGPIVEVTSPEAVDDPSDGGVLVESEVDVTCEVRAASGGGEVDPSTVSIQLLDGTDMVVDEVPAAPSGEPNEYTARVILTKVEESGVVGFTCTAGDLSSPPKLGRDTIHSYVDHGPLIEIISPEPDSAHPLKSALRVRFTVEADPLASRDPGAAVDVVTLDINGVSIDPGTPDDSEYDISIDLQDAALFPTVPTGNIPITITAINRRDPAATRVLGYSVDIDGEGPDITIESPQNQDVVGGLVPLRFSIVDGISGVDRDSIVVELNQIEYRYGEGGVWTQTGDAFVFTFDSTQAGASSVSQATINLDAADSVGNPAQGETLILYLDNVPPIVDLDPSLVREKKRGPENYCSLAFDPVGPRAANDADPTATPVRVQTYRALVWEQTNMASGQDDFYHAGTDIDSVYLYLQPNVNVPLLIDEDMDGTCEELSATRKVNPLNLPKHHLKGIAPKGTSLFGADADESEPQWASCAYKEEDVTDPAFLCEPTPADMYRIIKFDYDEEVPVIFAMGELEDEGVACIGAQWETAAFGEGWRCFAARALDNVGNVGISAPLRVCVDDGVDPPADCSDPPPSCTDGCTPPDHFPQTILLE
jgi:hypothetical protein